MQPIDQLIQHILTGRADPATVFARLAGVGDLNIPNGSGMTAAKAAVMNASQDVLRLLFVNGATPSDELLEFAERCYPTKRGIHAEIIRAMMELTIRDAGPADESAPPTRRRGSV